MGRLVTEKDFILRNLNEDDSSSLSDTIPSDSYESFQSTSSTLLIVKMSLDNERDNSDRHKCEIKNATRKK
jgi:hypothetical protein